MNSRQLTDPESINLAQLNAVGCESVLLFITRTGLEKSIMDATEPMRELFRKNSFHHFEAQLQGPENKVLKDASILEDDAISGVWLSLYRPRTKKGDPRMWLQNFKKYAQPDDVCAVFIRDGKLYLLNLTRSELSKIWDSEPTSPTVSFIKSIGASSEAVSLELLQMLRDIASKGPLRAVCEGDTAIGRSIETALGININSSQNPDYKGIEIKSGRSVILSKETRANLFACVPDWSISALKSSREILEKYGYIRDGRLQLYCTVTTAKANPQGLQLTLEEAKDWLKEISARPQVEDVCIWPLSKLHQRLLKKHKETFWVSAKATRINGTEYFSLEKVTHTANPSVLQFNRLLGDGTITLEHLVRATSNISISERGPLFKIERKRIPELFFGKPKEYSLICD